MIVFENEGEIPIEAIKTMGVSAKEGSRPIGYFGTGLKYAIAVLLREKHGVRIWRGDEALDFETRKTTIRGQDFEIVTMNGEDLGFTTALGKNWEIWQVLREIYCNCLDEDGDSLEFHGEYREWPSPGVGMTSVVVTGNEFEECWRRRAQFVRQDEPLVTGAEVSVHGGRSEIGYYRGIAARSLPKSSILSWNITGHCTLTEDRTIKYEWEFTDRVRAFVVRCEDADIVERVVTAPRDTFEGRLDFSVVPLTPSKTFLETVTRLQRTNPAAVNKTASDFVASTTKADMRPDSLELSPKDKARLDKAMFVLERAGFDISHYEVVPVEFLGSGVMGMAEHGRVYISRLAFNMGDRQLAGTLFEEWLHLRHEVFDESREMQNWLIDKLMEEIGA